MKMIKVCLNGQKLCMRNSSLLELITEVLKHLSLKRVNNTLRKGTSSQQLNLMPRYPLSILRPKPQKFQELLEKGLTREDPEGGYQGTKLPILQILSMAQTRFQSLVLDSGCWKLIVDKRHMFKEVELKERSR